jgi:hypothetical protein
MSQLPEKNIYLWSSVTHFEKNSKETFDVRLNNTHTQLRHEILQQLQTLAKLHLMLSKQSDGHSKIDGNHDDKQWNKRNILSLSRLNIVRNGKKMRGHISWTRRTHVSDWRWKILMRLLLPGIKMLKIIDSMAW